VPPPAPKVAPLRASGRARASPARSAKVLAARLYGVGPFAALAMTCWLAGADRFSSSRKAVRFAGLDITVSSPDRKGPPGRLSRQGPPVLRWALYEAGKTHAPSSAPDHRYYATVKDRKNSKRAALSEASKIVRQAATSWPSSATTRWPRPETARSRTW
jgi:transposase